MRIFEITKSPVALLREEIQQENATDFSTGDVMKILETHEHGVWEAMDVDEEIARLHHMANCDEEQQH